MIIEVRPTPALRRYRGRLGGGVGGRGRLAATLVSGAELANAADLNPRSVTVSDSAQR